jgi:hypothetical protein
LLDLSLWQLLIHQRLLLNLSLNQNLSQFLLQNQILYQNLPLNPFLLKIPVPSLRPSLIPFLNLSHCQTQYLNLLLSQNPKSLLSLLQSLN